jgi:hypothetical protein
MLENCSEHVRVCQLNAARCRETANTARTAELRNDYLDLEARWLALARSHEVTERVSRFLQEAERRNTP